MLQYHQLHHRLKIGVSSRSSMCMARDMIERESTMLVVIINSHYYALDFLWCRTWWFIYLHIFCFRNVTDIAAQWSASDFYTLNSGGVAIFAATGLGVLWRPLRLAFFLEILSGAPISHALLTQASNPASHEPLLLIICGNVLVQQQLLLIFFSIFDSKISIFLLSFITTCVDL